MVYRKIEVNGEEYYLTRVVESVKIIMFKENVIAYDV